MEEERVELTKRELDNINFRAGLVQQRSLELQILRREAQIYVNELIEKRGLEGNWIVKGDCLVKSEEEPEEEGKEESE